jgi:hypothetical protein
VFDVINLFIKTSDRRIEHREGPLKIQANSLHSSVRAKSNIYLAAWKSKKKFKATWEFARNELFPISFRLFLKRD